VLEHVDVGSTSIASG